MKPSDLYAVVWHTLAIYLFLIVVIRIFGKHSMGQLNAIDLIVIILLGSAVETAMVNANVSLPAGLICATVLMTLNKLFSQMMLRSDKLRHFVVGIPVVLVNEGVWIDENLKRCGLTHNDVLQAIRERELDGITNVKVAVLETDGRINVVPSEAKVHKSDVRTKATNVLQTVRQRDLSGDSTTNN